MVQFQTPFIKMLEIKMTDKPLCPLLDELGKPCNRPMFALPPESLPSAGVQVTVWQCFSLNNQHQIETKELIPAWEEFRKKRKDKISPTGRKMTPRTRRRILTMLAKGIPYVKISEKTGFSTPAICRLKQITMLATMGTVLRGMK